LRGNEKFANEKKQRPGVCGLCRQSINDEKIADLSSRSAGYVAPHNRFKIRLVLIFLKKKLHTLLFG
jgi:hypothetical protein